ncbi:putative N-acetyl-D-glucosamine kinase [Paratrimastix pyriformis]|uniref:N-acetyl-D-glucosamine kinase n=1 Tax=Paratrimastix pyriformis TaxID=342808 RepID=A0ABQ8UPH5_9EUKA|nr:putative N-acetyl-D-glucosamine kinase [Paratrimastix pyriformis]
MAQALGPLFGGIEGGATHSTVALMNTDGHIYGPYVIDKSTNHWTIGRETCYQNVLEMVQFAKQQCGCPIETPLRGLCLSLSGMEDVREQNKLIEALKQRDPHLSESYNVCNDSMGALVTASATGGLVLIAGTGSMCRLVTIEGSKDRHYRCGGWGHMIGDEGSAYYIAHKAVRMLYHAADGILPRIEGATPEAVQASLAYLRAKMCEFYKLADPSDILPHLYANFAKANFAGFAAKVAEGADEGDLCCRQIFQKAGRWLGMHIRAALGNLSPAQRATLTEHPVEIVCVGSVWKSWAHIRAGFMAALTEEHPADGGLVVPAPALRTPYRLVELTMTAAVGAALISAGQAAVSIPVDRSRYVRVLFDSAASA